MTRGPVLLFSEVFPPVKGGSGRWFWEVYSRWPREDVIVAADVDPQGPAFDRTHDLRIHRFPLQSPARGISSFSDLFGYCRVARHTARTIGELRRIVRAEGVEQLHCGRCIPEGWFGWLMRRLYGLRYSCYAHGEELNVAARSRELKWQARRALANAECVVANSKNTARILREDWNVEDARVKVLHPGVDTQWLAPAPRDREVRARLGWGERPVVLTVGRLQKRKGQDVMLRALPLLLERHRDFLYSIVGDGEERGSLESLTDELGLRGHVDFRGEPDDEELRQCYQQCDLFALPNRMVEGDFEGFGMVLLEAQACGKPVIAGASGGTAETMRVGETGYVVDCEGPDELSRLVLELLDDPDRREALGRAGREWVVEQFDWKALVVRSRDLFGY